MNSLECYQLIEETLTQHGNEVPRNREYMKHFFFKAGRAKFPVQYRQIVCLQQNHPEGFSWLIVNSVHKLFFVIPQQEAELVLNSSPPTCRQYHRDGGQRACTLRPARWNASISADLKFLKCARKSVNVEAYKDRGDLFEQKILPYWASIEKDFNIEEELPHKPCPRCAEVGFPDYGNPEFDQMCTKCSLWFRQRSKKYFACDPVERCWREWRPTSELS